MTVSDQSTETTTETHGAVLTDAAAAKTTAATAVSTRQLRTGVPPAWNNVEICRRSV